PDRPVDQARGQRLLLRRAPFALEEAARDLAGGIGFLDVVNGEREPVLPDLGGLGGDHGRQHYGVVDRADHGAVGLARDLAGLERHLVAAEGKSLLDWVHGDPWKQKTLIGGDERSALRHLDRPDYLRRPSFSIRSRYLSASLRFR